MSKFEKSEMTDFVSSTVCIFGFVYLDIDPILIGK